MAHTPAEALVLLLDDAVPAAPGDHDSMGGVGGTLLGHQVFLERDSHSAVAVLPGVDCSLGRALSAGVSGPRDRLG